MSNQASKPRRAKVAAALIGWGAVVWIAFLAGPYLIAFNDLISWR